MTSSERSQKVIFIRHGIARHNLPNATTGEMPNLRDPNLFDPSLVYQGKHQALHAGQRLQEWWHATQQGMNVELVVTSVYIEAIQRTIIFLHRPLPRGLRNALPRQAKAAIITGGKQRNKQADVQRIPILPKSPTHTHLLLWRSARKKYWPILRMDPKMTEMDEIWKEDTRETLNDLEHRISLFLNLLVGFSENNIVVVTHGVWLEECFRLHCPQVLEYGKKRVYNCDMFAFDCVSQNKSFLRLQNPHQI